MSSNSREKTKNLERKLKTQGGKIKTPGYKLNFSAFSKSEKDGQRTGFFERFEGNSILPKSLKLDFFPLETGFFGHFAQILHFIMDFRGKFEWGEPFYAIFITNFLGKCKKNTIFKQKWRKSFQK